MQKTLLAAVLTALMSTAALADSYEDAVDAALHNRPAVLEPLLQKGFDPNTTVPGGAADPLLTMAIRNKSDRVVALLLKQKNIDLNARNVYNETPLMLAVFTKQNKIAKQLVDAGADVNNPGYWSPLHYAANVGNLDMVNLLISKGADVNARTLRGHTPLYMAARDADADTVKALLKAGARKDFCTNDNLAPYDIAKKQQNTLEVQELLKYDMCR